jgi:hypothetical protein
MNTEIKVEPRSVYGETRIYPKCEKSQIFADMLGQATLTPRNIQAIIKLGYTVSAEHPPITFGVAA